MYHNIFIILLILNVQRLCSGQVLHFGLCSNVETMRYFELERTDVRSPFSLKLQDSLEYMNNADSHFDQFLGKWYQIERFPSWYEDGGGCSYKLIQQCGRRIEFQHGYVKDGVQFVLHVNSSYVPGDEAVFAIQENNIDPIGIPLSVIKTDYTNYAIVYGCKVNQIINLKYVIAWILSRESTLDADILSKARQDLNLLPSGSTGFLEVVRHDEKTCAHHWTAHVQAVYNNDTDIDT